MSQASFTRRQVMRSVGLGVFAAAATGVLANCSSGNGPSQAISNGNATLPKYIPLTITTPDLPPIDPTGVTGYFKFPKAFDSVSGDILTSGKPISILTNVSRAPYLPRDRNPIQQMVEARLGGQVNFVQISDSDYLSRFNTTIAGGKLPDVMNFTPVANYPSLFEKKFTDLTPFIGGDKIKDYPNLAAIPTVMWEACTVGNKIYGLPQGRGGTSGLGTYHKDLFDKAGAYPTNAEEFAAILKELTSPKSKVWGLVSNQGSSYNLRTYLQLFGAPYNWRKEADGSLVKDLETDQFRRAVEFAAKLYAAGVYHPNSNGPFRQMTAIFENGEAVVSGDTITSLPQSIENRKKLKPTADPQALTAFEAVAGTKPMVYLDALTREYSLISKASDDRVREILRLANYTAAPLGSSENVMMKYGKDGQTFDFDKDGGPVKREDMSTVGAPWGALCAGSMAIYDAKNADAVRAQYNGTKNLAPYFVADPVSGAYSPTDGSKGASLGQGITDTCTSIIAGRLPMSAFDAAVKKWKADGGDKMREEYQTALAEG